jgi:hypothetical protein
MTLQDSAEDLLVRARKGSLTDEEERRLAVVVQSSRELELLYEAGLQFDAEASLLSGDEARMAALVSGTLARMTQEEAAPASPGTHAVAARRARPGVLGARYFAASLAASLLLSVALASAWEYAQKRHWRLGAAPGVSLVAHSVPSARSLSPTAPEVPSVAAVSAVVASAPAAVRSAARKPTSRAISPARADSVPSASQLFADASEARRAGNVEAAILLYQRLCAEYPSSVEAEDAKVLMGNLLLSQRSARAALREFEGYGSGALTAEALWGQAQALRKLASPDERAVLERLARDYPSSPYAGAAQKRLRELVR